MQLIRYDAARTALAEAHRVDEAKEIRDRAAAVEAYARMAKDDSMIRMASEIKVRAERRAGELLKEQPKAKAGRPKIGPQEVPIIVNPTLADLDISKNESSRWQRLAEIPEEQFEHIVEVAKDTAGAVSSSIILKQHTKAATIDDGLKRWMTTNLSHWKKS